MADLDLSPAKAILLAVQLASAAEISALRSLTKRYYPRPLHRELVLRILLSHLPETVEPSEYTPLLESLLTGEFTDDSGDSINSDGLEGLNEAEAQKRVRKLKLLHLEWPYAAEDDPKDSFVCFLILRALRIDNESGLIAGLPELLGPFLHLSSYLRTWMISTVLPLVRLNYEYHPETTKPLPIVDFERLDDKAGVKLLLSSTGKDGDATGVGRDLKGLIGPWMYGDTRWKRRKLQGRSSSALQTVMAVDETPIAHERCISWEEVFQWIAEQATKSWQTTVEVVKQWDGPGDSDLGHYGDGSVWLNEDDQQYLERRYARSALAAAYSISEESVVALEGINSILERIITLMDQDRIPTLQAAAALLSPVSDLEQMVSPKNSAHLRNNLLSEQNIITSPKKASIRLLHALVVSAYICMRAGHKCTVRRAGELALLQDERDQEAEFKRLMLSVTDGPKQDDKYWVRLRNQILWLRSWGSEELSDRTHTDTTIGGGIFGKVSKDYVEAEILKIFLKNERFSLAKSIYEATSDQPLSKEILEKTVISAAMNAYDNATNAHKGRGGVKKCSDILTAFPDTLVDSREGEQIKNLIKVTDSIGQYRLYFKQGEPFKPVSLRVHGDPVSIIGKVLDLNPNSYTKMHDFIDMGKDMVKAGLVARDSSGRPKFLNEEETNEHYSIVERRIVSMCIDAALAEDDFETAYSYIVTRLKNVAGPAQQRAPEPITNDSGLLAEVPPKVVDDWSWRAALQAGRYKRNTSTRKPTHVGNASGNLEIRHLEQRMECLSQALRLAPRATLQEIINVYRRCEEELETQVKQEEEQEAAWDEQANNQAMPGGFSSVKKHATISTSIRAAEEAPMSLFDLSKASMSRAQTGLSALSMFKGVDQRGTYTQPPRPSDDSARTATPDSSFEQNRTRKRDQLKNAAVGGLATGIGWLVGAKPNLGDDDEDDEQR